MLFKNRKGQGSLEYLLLIGGVVLVAIVVSMIILNTGRGGDEQVEVSMDQYKDFIDTTIFSPTIRSSPVCTENNVSLKYNPSLTADVNYFVVVDGNLSTDLCELQTETTDTLDCTPKNNLSPATKYKIQLVAGKDGRYSNPSVSWNCTTPEAS